MPPRAAREYLAALDAHFSLVCEATNSGLSHRKALRAMQDEWAFPKASVRKASSDEASGKPGHHGIPEIGRAERAFYDALTEPQKAAYRSVQELVDRLYARNQSWEGIDPWEVTQPIDEWKSNAFNALATQPMKAYLLGQVLASEAMKEPMQRPLMPTDKRAIQFLEHYTFSELDAGFENLKGQLRTALIEGMLQGDNPKEVGRRLSNEFKDWETWLDVIAITETSRAESQGRLNELQDGGFEYAIGSSAHDSRVCPHCLRLVNDVVVRVRDTVGVSNYGRKVADWVTCIPLHPRCRCVFLPYIPGASRA